ncbi:MAG: hypothetical protein R6X20_03995 [Phycisphaerae bacterium]
MARISENWPDLAAVAKAWPDLPAAVKAGIVAMVKAADAGRDRDTA